MESTITGNVVYITDDGYIEPTIVSICSLIEHVNRNICIHVLGYELSDVSKSLLDEIDLKENQLIIYDLSQSIIDQTKSICNFNRSYGWISANAVAAVKFFIPLIMNKLDKVIYFDGDIIFQKNIDSVFEKNIDDVYLAATLDICGTDGEEEFRIKQLGIFEYFNSGVMVMNLKKMREDNISEKLVEYRKNGLNHFMDQDAWNVIVSDQKQILPINYNYLCSTFSPYSMEEFSKRYNTRHYNDVEECISEMTVLHLISKPWKNYHAIYSSFFVENYELTPFKSKELILYSKIPWNKFSCNARIVIYGAGHYGQLVQKLVSESKHGIIVAWVDSNASKIGIEGVDLPEVIKNVDYDYIIIAIDRYSIQKEIEKFLLLELGVQKSKVLKIKDDILFLGEKPRKELSISVIMPVHDEGDLIYASVKSVLYQTVSNLELIIVDDGSGEYTSNLCDNIAQNDTRVIVLHVENSGPMKARLKGVERASGDYITFIDADDFVENDVYEKMLRTAKQDYDIVIGGYIVESGDDQYCPFLKADIYRSNGICGMEEMFLRTRFNWALWDKIYKKCLFEVFNGDEEIPSIYGDDTYANWKLFNAASRICAIPIRGYHYRKRPDSLVHKEFSYDKLAYFDVWFAIIQWAKDKKLHGISDNVIKVMKDEGNKLLDDAEGVIDPKSIIKYRKMIDELK